MNRDLSPQQVADETGYSLSFVRREIKRGHLPAYKRGGRVRVERQALDEWKRQAAVCPPGEAAYEPPRARRSRARPDEGRFTSDLRTIRGSA